MDELDQAERNIEINRSASIARARMVVADMPGPAMCHRCGLGNDRRQAGYAVCRDCMEEGGNVGEKSAQIERAAKGNIQSVLEERGKRYGGFTEHADISQGIKGLISSGQAWRRMNNSQREALEMVAHKIGRIANGDPDYIDSWLDIVGYVQLVINELEADDAG